MTSKDTLSDSQLTLAIEMLKKRGEVVVSQSDYDNLKLASSPITSTPALALPPFGRGSSAGLGAKPKSQIPANLGRGSSLLTKFDTSNQSLQQQDLSSRIQALPHDMPKLPPFSGDENPPKGDATYDVWRCEVKCLLTDDTYTQQNVLSDTKIA